MYKIAIVGCSNPTKQKLEWLRDEHDVTFSKYLNSLDLQAKGKEFNELLKTQDYLFDISGGDLCNTLLPYTDLQGDAVYVGYSDNTVMHNARYTVTGKAGILYPASFLESNKNIWDPSLFDFPYHYEQGENLEGIVIGGNIRCFLKLAGTPYFPDCKGKVLLLESYSGSKYKMMSYLASLAQLGVFDEINGVLLGTFLEMDECHESMVELVKQYTNKPIVKTEYIGHRKDTKAIWIGKKKKFD